VTDELQKAKRMMAAATKRTTQLAEGTTIPDWYPTGDPAVDDARADAIAELGRQLAPEEAFNVAAGLEHDHRGPAPVRREDDPHTTGAYELPEAALARRAAAIAEREAASDVT
jgi:hypothetical protein